MNPILLAYLFVTHAPLARDARPSQFAFPLINGDGSIGRTMMYAPDDEPVTAYMMDPPDWTEMGVPPLSRRTFVLRKILLVGDPSIPMMFQVPFVFRAFIEDDAPDDKAVKAVYLWLRRN